MNAIGGMGGVGLGAGGASGVGSAGGIGTAAGTTAPAAINGSSPASAQARTGEAATQMTISQAAKDALAGEAPAAGASANSAERSAPKSAEASKSADPTQAQNVNSLGQNVCDLNKMSELLEALLMAIIAEKMKQGT